MSARGFLRNETAVADRDSAEARRARQARTGHVVGEEHPSQRTKRYDGPRRAQVDLVDGLRNLTFTGRDE